MIESIQIVPAQSKSTLPNTKSIDPNTAIIPKIEEQRKITQ